MNSIRLIISLATLKEIIRKCTGAQVEKVFIGVGTYDGRTYKVYDVFECRNISLTPETRFVVDPACLYGIYRYAEEKKLEIVTIIHSHSAPPNPSFEDLKGMKLWRTPWIIVNSISGEYRAWRIVNEHVEEVVVEIE